MAITFTDIPSGIKVPGTYTEFDTSSGVKGVPGNPRTIAVVAQKTTADTVKEENIIFQVFSESEVEAQAGSGSIAHLTARAIFRSQKQTTLFMVYQNDAGGASPAVGSITVANNASSSGFLNIWIGSVRLQINVDNADTPTVIAAAINTAINAKSDLPVTSTVLVGVVTVTAKNDGTLGNAIPIAHEINDIGTITVVDVQPTGGATDPTFQDALDALFQSRDIRHIYSTYNDATNLGLLKTHLIASADPVERNRKLGWSGSGYLTVSAVNSIANTLNNERLEIAYLRYSKTSAQGHSLDYEIGGANVAKYAIGTNPALPRGGLPLAGIVPPSLNEQLSFNEQQSLITNGVAPLQTLPGEGVSIVKTVSTRTSTSGIEDFTLLEIQTMDTLDGVADAAESMFNRKFRQRGINDLTIRSIKSEILDILKSKELTEELRDVEENKDRIIVEEAGPSNRGQVNLDIPAEVVPGLDVIAEKVTLIIN